MITRLGTYSEIKGSSIKIPCVVATTGAITLSGTQAIDGVAVIVGDRVLVNNQGTESTNGIYVVAASTWSRAIDMSLDDDVYTGLQIYITSGTANGGKFFALTTDNPITLGVTALSFAISAAPSSSISGTPNYVAKFTSSSTISNSLLFDNGSGVTVGSETVVRAFNIYSATADNQLLIAGSAPSVSLADALTGATYQAKFGLATASNNFVTNSVAGDFAISSQGTSNILFGINGVEAMRVFGSTKNVSIGGNSTDGGYKLDVNGTGRVSGDVTFGNDINLTRAGSPAIVSTTNQNIRLVTNSFTATLRTDGAFTTSTGFRTDGFVQTVNLAVGASYYNITPPTNGAIIQGNVLIGTTTDAGYKLDVNGTGRFSDALSGTSASFSSTLNVDGTGLINISYSDISTGANKGLRIVNTDATEGTAYNITSGRTGANNGDFVIRNTTTNVNNLIFNRSTGAATFSSSVTAVGAIITNANFIISQPIYSTTGNAGNLLFTNTYPSTYNVAEIASVLDGYYYAAKLVFRTADQYNANLLVDRLTIASTGAATFSSSVTASSLIKSGGTSSQFLMADGSVNTSVLPSGAYLPLTGGTLTGGLTISMANYPQLILNSTNSNGPILKFQEGGVDKALIGHITQITGLQFSGNGSTAQATLDASGNLGLGTASPNRNLVIDGGSNDSYLKLINSSTSASIASGILFDNNLNGDGNVYIRLVGNSNQLSYNTSGTHYFGGGNVLILTTTDAGYLLDVNGTGRFSGALTGTSATFSSSVTATNGIFTGSGIKISSNSAGSGSTFTFDYTANAASRTWRLANDYQAYGDFTLQQSTTQTGSTYANILYFGSTGAATFSSSVTTGGNITINGTTNGLNVKNAGYSIGWFAAAGASTDYSNLSAAGDAILSLAQTAGYTANKMIVSNQNNGDIIYSFGTAASNDVEKFRMVKDGQFQTLTLKTAAPTTATAGTMKFGAVQTGLAVGTAGYWTVNIDGTDYYINLSSTSP